MLAPIEEIFCEIDDFCKEIETHQTKKLLPNENRQCLRPCRLAISEIMTITVLFHLSHYRNFKAYYYECVIPHLTIFFPNLVSYNRFLELKQMIAPVIFLFLQRHHGQETGTYFVDATKLPVCHNKRIRRHKVFSGYGGRV